MQTKRLFDIVYLLVEKGQTTAQELSETFSVATRTIYRDIEKLQAAGIPVYSEKGRGGGIGIKRDFLANSSILSIEEQQHIMRGISALKDKGGEEDDSTALIKLSEMFGRSEVQWLQVDFSGSRQGVRSTVFEVLREAIVSRRVIHFSYHTNKGERSGRLVEPLKLAYKNNKWYLCGYCRQKRAVTVFEVWRIKGIVLTAEGFSREIPESVEVSAGEGERSVSVKLLLSGRAAIEVYDSFLPERVERRPDGSCIVQTEFDTAEEALATVFKFSGEAKILSPSSLAEQYTNRIGQIVNTLRKV